MRMTTFLRAAVMVAVAVGSTLTPASAQSVFATRGLGYPMFPQDARSASLGGVRLGLPGPEITWGNPAAAAGLPAAGLTFSYQFDDFDAEFGSTRASGGAGRFPMILATIPAGDRYAFQAGFGSFFEQNWQISESSTIRIGDEDVQVVDWFQSRGGASRLRFAGAAAVRSDFSVGAGLDVYTGSVDRLLGRALPEDGLPTCCSARWNYSGTGFIVGVNWNPSEAGAASVALSYGGTIEASPRDSVGRPSAIDLPITVEAGASGRIGANTLVAIGGSWAGWSTASDDLLAAGGSEDVWAARVGIEWDGMTFNDRPIPLRVGVRTERLPFGWDADGGDSASISERAVSIGLGLQLGGGGVRGDTFFEIGNRGGDSPVDESFRRFGISVRVLGP